ncbi:MAG TPA: hypothetical protein VEQ58_02225, partial [Polyangiaceae bacterium]|nr:hypothetical protein [Polyangiaceae bacterium]
QEPIRVRGVVTARQLSEEPADIAPEKPLLWRCYRVEFCDPARAYWRHHFPVALLTNESWLNALKAQAGALFQVSSTFAAVTQERPQLFIHAPRDRQLSFYDFVLWLLDGFGGCWIYDYESGDYQLAADESSTAKEAALFGDDVQRVAVSARPRDLAQPRVLNSYALGPATLSPQVEGALAPVFADQLLRTAVLAEQDAAAQLEVGTRDQGGLGVRLTLGALSPALGAPGAQLVCRPKQRFAASSLILQGKFRVHALWLEAVATSPDLDTEHQRDSVAMSVACEIDLKQSTDVRPVRRSGAAPHYPGLLEGLVVSEQGAKSDLTWDMVQAEGTQAEQVVVSVPLFEKAVSVPFEPGFDSFNTFRPRARDERVLVALDLHTAHLVRTLSFRAEAILPADVCGEQLVFGKSAKSITKLSHQYAGEEPVLDLLRTHEQDQVRFTMSEGKLTIFVAQQEG